MNANAIQEKILSDARTSASDIMRDANEKAARLRDAAEKRMAAAHSRLMMQASEDAEAARLRMERMEELEERKRLLSDKRALIDEAFAQALDKLEAMTCVCSVGLDMIAVPGDTSASTLSAILADEAAIGMINNKTTATRLIPVPGKKPGDMVQFGGLMGYAPVMGISKFKADEFVARGGKIPAPLRSLTN